MAAAGRAMSEDDLARVEKRREFPARVTQFQFPQNRSQPPSAVADRCSRASAIAPIPARLLGLACGRNVRTQGRESRSNKAWRKAVALRVEWQMCGAPKCCGSKSAPEPAHFSSVMRRDVRAFGWSTQAKLFQAG